MRFADLAIPSPLRSSFTYALSEGAEVSPGMRILVEFGRKKTIGLVLSVNDTPPVGIEIPRIKQILEVLDKAPSVSPAMLDLIRWMSTYYFAPIGEALRAALPSRMLNPSAPKTTRPEKPIEISPLGGEAVQLSSDQEKALDEIIEASKSKGRSTYLLHGVTGSGKTEVYLRLFESIVGRGRQCLLLVPEIGLTPQLAGCAAQRFGERISVYHSGLTDAQRHAQWRRMKDGMVDVVIGTRSALFAPLPNLGAIVVDEEHDGSYKQDEGFTYNGRDCAVMRAHIEEIICVLGSATPSLESHANARSGKYRLRELPQRIGEASMPSVEIVDMRAKPAGRDSIGLSSLSPLLHDAISETLDRKEQVLLFIGRRGFASAVHCESCGKAAICPNCDISLAAHADKGGDFLSCHYCGYRIRSPESCAACGSTELTPIGHGTQRLEAELSDFFPQARIARMDSDMATGRKERGRILRGMRRGEIDILVGTQMVTKGHDFPGITLVGVVSADQTLHMPDFRAAERTLQILTQVAGRAGRGDKPGRVIIQTWQPEHPSIAAAAIHDFGGFVEKELEYRKKAGYPPFGRIACVRISSLKADLAKKTAERLGLAMKDAAGQRDGIIILGPATAPMGKIRNRYRWQLLIKAQGAQALSSFLARIGHLLEGREKGARISIDIDPSNLL